VLAQTGLSFDLSTASGKLMRTIMAGLAEFERDLIRERVKSGLAAAQARGVVLGRPKFSGGRQTERLPRATMCRLGPAYPQEAKFTNGEFANLLGEHPLPRALAHQHERRPVLRMRLLRSARGDHPRHRAAQCLRSAELPDQEQASKNDRPE
jgi:Resolvase, N terminal domain